MKNFVISIFLTLTLLPLESRATGEEDKFVPIRIGWQIPAATQGQIVQVLKRTNVLDAHGLDPILEPFSYGGPQVEAAFAGKLDVIFSGDQPAINLIARGGRWKIVARLFEDRVATILPPNSPIRELRDLAGKTVASPFGSVGQRDAFLQQQAAGLDPYTDVINQNMDILEIRRRVMAGGGESWNGIDAAVIWDPLAARFEIDDQAQVLAARPYLGVVAISEEFIANNPETAAQFLAALMRAWEFLSARTDMVMQWYINDTRLGYRTDELVSARLDRNFRAASLQDIDLQLTEEDIATLKQSAAWAEYSGEGSVTVAKSVDSSLVDRAQEVIAAGDLDEIEIILPVSGNVSLIDKQYRYVFDAAPIGIVFSVMVLIALLAIEVGFRLGRHGVKKLDTKSLQPIATVVGAVLGMMAFVIALTFGSANSRFDERKSALLADVTAIQTAYLRAKLLPEPHRTTVRSLLRDYVHLRVGIVYAYEFPSRLEVMQRRAEALQTSMWSHVESLGESGSNPRVQILFASALNDVFSLHTKRVVLGAYFQIPVFVWISLLFASSLAMFAVGYQFGATGGQRIVVANLALSLTFALVMLLAIDLDRTGEGLIAVNQQPMIDLYRSMGTTN